MDPVALTPATTLDLLRRTTDPNWLAGWLAQPDATAILAAKIAVAVAASEAVMAQGAACSIWSAPAGRPGVCALTIRRPIVATTATIPAGYKFVDNRGVELVVSLSVPVAAGQADILLPLVSLRQIDLVNNPEPAFDVNLQAGATVNPIIAAESSNVLDSGGNVLLSNTVACSATYLSSTAIVGAELDWLSLHGEERGYRRQYGEDGELYRLRVRRIPEAATPVVIQEAARSAAAAADLPDVWMVEPMLDQASDVARLAIQLASADSPAEGDYFDDPVGVVTTAKLPWRALEILDIRGARAYFRHSVNGVLRASDGLVPYYDDAFADDDLWGFPDLGWHPEIVAALMAIFSVVDTLRAAGVQHDLYVEDSVVIPPAGVEVAGGMHLALTLMWTIYSDPLAAPGAWTQAWLLRHGLVSHAVGGIAHQIRFTFSDGTTFTTPLFMGADSEQLTRARLEATGFPFKPVVEIAGYGQSAGPLPILLAGTFWAAPYAL